MTIEGLWVVEQQRVNEAKQLHDSFTLTEVLMALQQEHEVMTVAICVRGGDY